MLAFSRLQSRKMPPIQSHDCGGLVWRHMRYATLAYLPLDLHDVLRICT